jgi:Holliday junction resolvase RusA-like endonuclease
MVAFPPFQIVVPGTPASVNAKTKAGYARKAKFIEDVAAAAAAALPPQATTTAALVSVTVHYCYWRRFIDIDNFLKPLLDGLKNGGVYMDDRQVARLLVERIDVSRPFIAPMVTAEIASPLAAKQDFVVIRVEEM